MGHLVSFIAAITEVEALDCYGGSHSIFVIDINFEGYNPHAQIYI